MLRSFRLLQQGAAAGTIIASDEGQMIVKGGGRGYAKPWHWHDCMMLLLPDVGAMEIRHEDRLGGVWVSQEEFALVPASRAHETQIFRDANAHLALYVTEAAMQCFEADLGSFGRVRRNTRAVAVYNLSGEARTLRNLCATYDAAAVGAVAIRRHLSSALLLQCLATVQDCVPLSPASHREHGAALVWEIQAYVSAHAELDLSIDRLAERFGISRRHITRLFRDRAGISIGGFHQAARLARARRLLEDTDLPVGQIAFRVGFDSGSALARALRRDEGRSPSDLRPRMARPVARRGPFGSA